tara:strand:- start:3771 stop:4013 length:243 start_codon:yes stop_codon:yes gene_type:complete
MFSTLSETTSTKSLPIPIPKKWVISTPISIPKQSDNSLSSEFELNLIFFNPSKMSPPDCWKTRLEQRIKNYNIYDRDLKE